MAPNLGDDVQNKLSCFNSALPQENMEVWVTIEEMRERPIHGGVNCMLSTLTGSRLAGTTFVGGVGVAAGREDEDWVTERWMLPGRNPQDDIVAWGLVVVVTDQALLEVGDNDARELAGSMVSRSLNLMLSLPGVR